MQPTLYFEDFVVGQTVEAQGPTITKEAIIAFATQFDPQPFHIDEEAAKESSFGGLVASGWHTASLCMRMMCDAYALKSAGMGSPGVDELRWLKPVHAGDSIRMKATVLEVKPSRSRPEMGAVKHEWLVFNQRDEPVMRMLGWGLFRKRSPG